MSKPTIRAVQFSLLAFLLCVLCVSSPLLSALNSPLPQPPKIYGTALVRLRVTNLEVSRRFYASTLGLPQGNQGCFDAQGAAVCFFVSSQQQVELVSGAASAEGLETLGFRVSDAASMRKYLVAKGVKCGEVIRSNSGDDVLEVHDPENHRILFLSHEGGIAGSLSPSLISSHLIHAGFVVHDRAAEDRLYKAILGFKVYWQGGMKDDETNWVDMQVPDGSDWLEYMLNVPADADHHTLGVMNHIALGVRDIHAAQQQLIKNGWKGTEQPKIGRDGKWQLNLYDPDDTRVELMEFTPVEKPCCSEYTGPHPKP